MTGNEGVEIQIPCEMTGKLKLAMNFEKTVSSEAKDRLRDPVHMAKEKIRIVIARESNFIAGILNFLPKKTRIVTAKTHNCNRISTHGSEVLSFESQGYQGTPSI